MLVEGLGRQDVERERRMKEDKRGGGRGVGGIWSGYVEGG
jgi:hypothetical protein